MAKVRIIKTYEEKQIVTRAGKMLYVVQAAVNFLVEEDKEYLANIFTGFSISEGEEYEFSLNNMNIRLREPRISAIPGVPIPGVNSNNAKKP
jgi:hypothetical protein